MTFLNSLKRRFLGGITVASYESPWWMRRLADYVCDGVDDQVQIQAAIDEVQSLIPGGGALAGAGNVQILPGRYYLGGGITGKSARIIGSGYNSGVRIHWNAVGGTAWTQSGVSLGSLTYGGIEGITFLGGTGAPDVWLDLSADGIDNGWRLRDVGFGGGAVQIKTGTWVNAHWSNLRFDNWTDFAIVLIPGGTQNLATLVIDQFTMDHHPVVGANGFIKIDNTSNSGNLGTFRLSNGRMESNTAFGGNKGLIELITPNPGNTRVICIELSNVTYQEIAATPATHSLIFSNTAATTIGISLMLNNFRQSGLDAIFAGTLSSFAAILPIQANYGYATVSTGGYDAIAGNFRGQASASGGTPFSAFRGVEANARWSMDQDGKQTWGTGSAVGDATLSRRGTDLIGTDDGDSFIAGNGTWNGGRLRLGVYHLWVDATGNLRIKSGAPTSDTDGAVVGTQT